MANFMWKDGKILFNGSNIAMSEDCCCDLTCEAIRNCFKCGTTRCRDLELTISGITTSPCVGCTGLNGTRILIHAAPCFPGEPANCGITYITPGPGGQGGLCGTGNVAIRASFGGGPPWLIEIDVFQVSSGFVFLRWGTLLTESDLAEAMIKELCAGGTVTIPLTINSGHCRGVPFLTARLLPC